MPLKRPKNTAERHAGGWPWVCVVGESPKYPVQLEVPSTGTTRYLWTARHRTQSLGTASVTVSVPPQDIHFRTHWKPSIVIDSTERVPIRFHGGPGGKIRTSTTDVWVDRTEYVCLCTYCTEYAIQHHDHRAGRCYGEQSPLSSPRLSYFQSTPLLHVRSRSGGRSRERRLVIHI
jgi:hypothetical protein